MTYAERLSDADDLLKGLEVGVHDDCRVDLSLEEALHGRHDLAGKDDHRGGAITDLLILRSRQLNHALGCWVSHVDLYTLLN